MKDFTKVVRLGKLWCFDGQACNVFCKIEYKYGAFSICGVEGPLFNGNCIGSCGQINMSLKAKNIEPAPGWTKEMLDRFFSNWDAWHLNNMRAGCEHQRKLGWGSIELTLNHYSYDYKAYDELKKQVVEEVKNETGWVIDTDDLFSLQKATGYSPIAHYLVALRMLNISAFSRTTLDPDVVNERLGGLFDAWPEFKANLKVENAIKRSGWVYETEHKDGVLCKPCPECGYKYGTSWLREEVPEEVLEFMFNLPDTDETPAWV